MIIQGNLKKFYDWLLNVKKWNKIEM